METMYFSDSEDDFNCSSEKSFNSFSSQYEAKANEELGSSDASSADSESLIDLLNNESLEEPGQDLPPADDGTDEDMSTYTPIKKAQIPPDYEIVGSLVFSSSKHSDHGQALDYALIRFHFTDDAVDHDPSSSSSPGLSRFPEYIPREAYQTHTSTTVAANTASVGIVTGTIELTPVYMRVPGGTTYQEVYTVSLNKPLSDGDCGSWVYDTTSMRLRGHIIAGSPDTRTAFVVPAFEVFDNIRSMIHIIRTRTDAESRRSSLQPVQNPDNAGKDFEETRPPLSASDQVTSAGHHHDHSGLVSRSNSFDSKSSVLLPTPRKAPNHLYKGMS
jgi:peptide-N4-(N-acetyl-beta-glucosaminyl)asparagine amidase